MDNFYIADTHFGHRNVIKFSKRPFSSVEEMDNCLINNWNSVVFAKDDVYMLGDFCYHNENSPDYYLNKLNGKIHLILGNHDKAIRKSKNNKIVSIDI